MREKTTRQALSSLKHLLSALLFLLPFFGLAQAGGGSPVLSGKILDVSNQKPVHGATISLLKKDSTVLSGTTTREDGSFRFLTFPDGPFLVRVSMIGYPTLVREIPAGHKGAVTLGTLRLTPAAAQLQTVVVVGEKAAFKTEIDKKIFNVDRSLASKGGTAADALRQVPTLSIDATGNVTLRNGSPVILVDGKRTSLTLDQIPSDQIESIEVIPNPSARYDAQGNHGIVNIVMKKNRKPGANGSVTGVWSTLRELYGFVNANVYKNRWNFTLNYMAHRHRSVQNTNTVLTDLTNNTSLVQNGQSTRTGPFQKIRGGIDFFMDSHNTFSLSSDVGIGFHPSAGWQVSDYLDSKGVLDSSSSRQTYDAERFTFTHTQLDYTHIFRKPSEKLTVSGNLETFYGPGHGNYSMQYLDKGGAVSGNPYLQQYSGFGRANNWTLQSDFSDPLREGKARLEAGIKATLNNDRSYNDFQDYNTSGGDYVVDTNASYNYSYTDNTYAAYTSYSDKIGSHFSYMAGLRFEQYDYTGHLLNDNTGFSYRNTGFYPSLFLTEKVGDNSEFHLNYSRRVNHPEWWQMTPWTNYSNPQNPQRGNPAVQSENTNLGELAFNTTISGVSVNSTLYVKNTLSPIISYNMPLSGDTLLSTFENAKSTNTYGAELVVKVPILNWWTTTANLNAFQTSINADNLADGLSNSGFSWFGKVSSEMKIVHIYTFQVTGNYNAANVIAQGKVMASGGVDAALKRDFLKNNSGTLVLSVSDIFNTQQYRTITSSPGSFIQNALTKPITRVFKVNFTYTFGKEKNGERKKATSVSTD